MTTFQDNPAQEPPPPELGRIALNWLSQYGNTFGLLGLALICLLVIRSIVRGVTSTSAESAENAEQAKPLAAESDDDIRPQSSPMFPPRIGNAISARTAFRSARSFRSLSRRTRKRPQISSATGLDRRVDRWTLPQPHFMTLESARRPFSWPVSIRPRPTRCWTIWSSAQAALVRRGGDVDRRDRPEELQRVIDEFRRIGPLVPGSRPRASSWTGCTKPRVHPLSSSEHRIAMSENGEPAAEPFGFLDNAEDDELAHLLGGERPQTAALGAFPICRPIGRAESWPVLLPPCRSKSSAAWPTWKTPIPKVLREVEKSLETRLSRYFAAKNERSAGPEAVDANPRRLRSEVAPADSRQPRHERLALAERFGRRPIQFRGPCPTSTMQRCRRSSRPRNRKWCKRRCWERRRRSSSVSCAASSPRNRGDCAAV